MRLVEAAWLAQPHPDLADAYAHVKLGDSARQRLVRIETLAEKAPGHVESALAVARAAIDASEFLRARDVLAPFVANPTQRVAMLMAEIERGEHGDSGRARAWMLRAVRARHDPVWTADGYVSDRWRPVSPVTGRLDAFQWQTPLAALPSDKTVTVEASPFEEAMLAPPRQVAVESSPPRAVSTESVAAVAVPAAPAAAQDNSPAPAAVEATPPPLFRPRPDPARNGAFAVPPVIPIVRAPDDPGIDDEPPGNEFAEPADPAQAQAGGWRGFLSRWGG
jgi:HemY protein